MDQACIGLDYWIFIRGISLRVITRKVEWKENPSGVEFVVLPDRTPFSRFNNNRFEHQALNYVNENWPTIGISRVTGKVDVVISGGTHKVHLRDKGKRPGFFVVRLLPMKKNYTAMQK